MPILFERAVIAGVGLIGGSLAAAAKQRGLIGELVGFGRTAGNLDTAVSLGLIDRYSLDAREAARGADLLLLAVPVNAMAPVVEACAPVLAPGAVVSDAGSVKQSVIATVEAVLPAGLSFVGAHPIAGSEETGAAAARADLFFGAECVLTPSARSTPEATGKVRALWEGVGMRTTEMTAAEHDRTLAWVSHVPHAMAFALVNSIATHAAEAPAHSGPSLRECTRIAASSPELWRDVFLSNSDAVGLALDALIQSLSAMREAIRHGDATAIHKAITAARDAKTSWRDSDEEPR